MSNLPTIAELTTDIESASKLDKLQVLLNQQPPEKWIKYHPFIKDRQGNLTHRYLPIDKVEYLLRRIFKQYRIEITGQGTAFNGVWVTVRVHYLHPVMNDWNYVDGIGAIQLQTKQGSSPADLGNINNGAISMAFPHAKTLAIKDACDNLGTLFGADLNRRDTLGYQMDAEIQSRASKPVLDDSDLEFAKKRIDDGELTIDKLTEMFTVSAEQLKELMK